MSDVIVHCPLCTLKLPKWETDANFGYCVNCAVAIHAHQQGILKSRDPSLISPGFKLAAGLRHSMKRRRFKREDKVILIKLLISHVQYEDEQAEDAKDEDE
jgi:hypothetical protein